MPAAIPIAAAVVPSIIGGVLQNGQNKSTVQNAQNATASARTADAAALQKALAGLAQYTKSNPSPASQYAPIKGPSSVYGQPQSAVNSPTQNVSPGSLAAALGGGQGQPHAQGNGMTLPIMGPRLGNV